MSPRPTVTGTLRRLSAGAIAPGAVFGGPARAAILLGLFLWSGATQAATTTVIYNFTGGSDGSTPLSPLTPDGLGNFYGTTQQGGNFNPDCAPDGCGTVFKIDRNGKLTTLHAFASGTDGTFPEANVGLALIGGTLYGNVPGGTEATGYSQFFSIKTDGSSYQVLYSMSQAQGEFLVGTLQPALGGIAFGLGQGGGKYGRGTLFFLSDAAGPAVVHDFAGGADGDTPTDLIEDSQHNLFGSTKRGGQCPTKGGCGVVFEYVPATKTYTVLYAFQGGDDGSFPLLGAVGPEGTLYGVTKRDGADKHGALFVLKLDGAGYTFSVLSPIKIKQPGDGVINAPALAASGALIGGTGGGTYAYQNGQYTITYSTDYPEPYGQFVLFGARPDAIAAASAQGSTSGACASVGGCGFIYYQR